MYKRHFTGLWQHPDFMKLWTGQTISEFGSRITREALPLVAVIVLAASPAEMGILTAISALPVLLFSLAAGVWVDRVRRRPVMIAADIARLLILLSVPFAALTGTLTIELLYLVVALTTLLGLVFEIAYRAILPSLISREHLLEGNTKLATTDSLAEIGGPAIAGLLVQVISAPVAIIFDAASYLFSALSFALIRAPEPPPAPATAARNAWAEMLDGWRCIAADPILRVLVAELCIGNFFGSFYAVLYGLYAIRDLGLSPAQLGLVVGAGGIGALLGALVAGWVPRRYRLGQVLTTCILFGAGLNVLIPLAGGTPIFAAAVLITAQILGDGARTVYEINALSLRQSLVPDRLLGRVNASIGFLAHGIAPVGALVGGALATALDARTTLFIAFVGLFVGALWVARSPVRKLQAYGEVVQV